MGIRAKKLGEMSDIVRHVVSEGERFDAMSVRRWRERVLSGVRR